MGRAIKLLATSRKTENGYAAMVAPRMITAEHPLYNVNGVFNAIFVHGNVLGDAMFYGSGAGKLPTASAVIADIIDIVKHLHKNILVAWSSKKLELSDYEKSSCRFFVRTAKSEEEVKKIFTDAEIIRVPGIDDETGFLTQEMSEFDYKEAAERLGEIRQMIRA